MKKMDFNYVMEVLNNCGIDDDYFDSMGGKEVEDGSEEWMDVISEIIGKNVFEVEGDLNNKDFKLVMEFRNIMEENGIEFI
jgi:hypothetical protein